MPRHDLRAAVLWSSRAIGVPRGPHGALPRGLHTLRSSWWRLSRLGAEREASHPRVELSKGQSRSPASSIERRAFLHGCGGSPRARIRQPASRVLFPAACPGVPAPVFSLQALLFSNCVAQPVLSRRASSGAPARSIKINGLAAKTVPRGKLTRSSACLNQPRTARQARDWRRYRCHRDPRCVGSRTHCVLRTR